MPYMQKPTSGGPIRRFLVRGLFILLPGALTLWAVTFAFGMADSWLGPMVDALVRAIVPAQFLVGPFAGGHIPGLSFFVLILVLVVFGAITSVGVGAALFRKVDAAISMLPGAGVIYKGVRKVGDLFTGQKEVPFQKVVHIPVMGNLALGFVTGRAKDRATGQVFVRVVIPTPPNPFSGFIFTVPEEDCIDAGMTVEEGMQYFMSFGMVGPAEMNLTPPNRTGRGGE